MLVTDSQTWLESFDFRVVAEGGIVVDTNESSHEIYMPAARRRNCPDPVVRIVGQAQEADSHPSSCGRSN